MNAAAHNSDAALAVDVPAYAGVRGSALVARYADGSPVRVGDHVRIHKADCTVLREILSRAGEPHQVVVDIVGIPLRGGHAPSASNFAKIEPPTRTIKESEYKPEEPAKVEARKARFSDPKFWDSFGKNMIPADQRPTISEAADFVITLFVQLEAAKKEIAAASLEAKCAHQEFRNFALEVANLADKRRTVGKNS